MINIAVADTFFSIVTRKESALKIRMNENYGVFMAGSDLTDNDILFRVDLDVCGQPAYSATTKTFKYEIGPDIATLNICSDGNYVLSIHNAESGHDFWIACHNSTVTTLPYEYRSNIATLRTAPPKHILDHLLIFALSVAGLRKNILLIHASTIVYERKAMMYLGESGTGKSTHTRMWLENVAGTRLLNDDAPALRVFPDGRVSAYGTPWSGKTPCYLNESYPLAAMTRIKRAPYNRMSRCKSVAAFGAVLPSCMPTLQQCDLTLDPLCETLSALLQYVPVYTLECLPDPDAALTAKTAIFGAMH